LAITCKTRRITLTSDLLLFSNFSTKGRFIARSTEWRSAGRFIPTVRHVRLYNIVLHRMETTSTFSLKIESARAFSATALSATLRFRRISGHWMSMQFRKKRREIRLRSTLFCILVSYNIMWHQYRPGHGHCRAANLSP